MVQAITVAQRDLGGAADNADAMYSRAAEVYCEQLTLILTNPNVAPPSPQELRPNRTSAALIKEAMEGASRYQQRIEEERQHMEREGQAARTSGGGSSSNGAAAQSGALVIGAAASAASSSVVALVEEDSTLSAILDPLAALAQAGGGDEGGGNVGGASSGGGAAKRKAKEEPTQKQVGKARRNATLNANVKTETFTVRRDEMDGLWVDGEKGEKRLDDRRLSRLARSDALTEVVGTKRGNGRTAAHIRQDVLSNWPMSGGMPVASVQVKGEADVP